jgi:hypothetical protein
MIGSPWIRPCAAIAAAVAMAACGDSPTNPGAAPAVLTTRVDDAGAIARAVFVELDGPGAVRVQYWSDDGPRLEVTESGISPTHVVELFRLRSASTYQYEVTPVGSDGVPGTLVGGEFETDTLPARISRITPNISGEPSFPLLMLEAFNRVGTLDMPVIIDSQGEVVWYRQGSQAAALGFDILEDGNFVFQASPNVEVVTPFNQVVATLSEEDAATRTGLGSFDIHHDIVVTPDNTILLLVQDTGTVNDTVWAGEAVWEWNYRTDVLEKRWSTFDVLSPSSHRGPRSVPNDWLHANSLSMGPRGNLLMSLFFTHEVISIAPDFQSLEWRLGGPDSSFDVLDGGMDAGQHTAREVGTDRILLFDNGRDRPGGELYSRALELEIDRLSNTAGIVWEFRPSPDIYAPIVGSTYRLSDGNTVSAFGVSPGFAGMPATGPVAVYETSAQGIVAAIEFDGIEVLYRATPMFTIGGEVEVLADGPP